MPTEFPEGHPGRTGEPAPQLWKKYEESFSAVDTGWDGVEVSEVDTFALDISHLGVLRGAGSLTLYTRTDGHRLFTAPKYTGFRRNQLGVSGNLGSLEATVESHVRPSGTYMKRARLQAGQTALIFSALWAAILAIGGDFLDGLVLFFYFWLFFEAQVFAIGLVVGGWELGRKMAWEVFPGVPAAGCIGVLGVMAFALLMRGAATLLGVEEVMPGASIEHKMVMAGTKAVGLAVLQVSGWSAIVFSDGGWGRSRELIRATLVPAITVGFAAGAVASGLALGDWLRRLLVHAPIVYLVLAHVVSRFERIDCPWGEESEVA